MICITCSRGRRPRYGTCQVPVCFVLPQEVKGAHRDCRGVRAKLLCKASQKGKRKRFGTHVLGLIAGARRFRAQGSLVLWFYCATSQDVAITHPHGDGARRWFIKALQKRRWARTDDFGTGGPFHTRPLSNTLVYDVHVVLWAALLNNKLIFLVTAGQVSATHDAQHTVACMRVRLAAYVKHTPRNAGTFSVTKGVCGVSRRVLTCLASSPGVRWKGYCTSPPPRLARRYTGVVHAAQPRQLARI